MSVRLSPKNPSSVSIALLLVLVLSACSFPFGRGRQADTTADVEVTATIPPTQTTAPPVAIVTPTPTITPELATPTPTATSTPVPTTEPEPTATATPEPTKESSPTSAVAPAGQTSGPWFTTGRVTRNGSFEEGFDGTGVAVGWTAFSTAHSGAVYAWEDDTDWQHISHGEHAQLMRIMGPAEPNTFVGIRQTVDVVASETYTLALHGVIRSSTADDDYKPLAFRLQWATVEGGEVDWQAVDWTKWTELGWTDVQLDKKWPEMNAYVTHITPQSNTLTLLIRGWSKWPLFQDEVKFHVDGVFLDGPVPAPRGAAVPAIEPAAMPTTGGATTWIIPLVGLIGVLGLAVWEVRQVWAR